MTQRIFVDPRFGSLLREHRERNRLSLRRLGDAVHISHGFIWDLEVGKKKPSLNVAALLDAALGAGGQLSAMVRELSADSPDPPSTADVATDPASAALEFAADWRHGIEAVVELWRTDMQRRNLLNITAFSALAFMTPAMRWLTNPLDEQPARSGVRIVGEPDVEMVRRITGAFRTLDNQFGGGHVRDSVVRFLDGEVAPLLTGHYDARTGTALLSATAEATQLAGWASYDAGMDGLAQRYMIQALRLAAAAGDRPLGAEILAAMSHQAAYLRAGAEAVDLARAAGRAAADAGVAAVQAESAVLEAQGHAVGGNEAACAVALDRAEKLLDRADRAADPQWLGYFDEAYLAAKFGHCFTALGRGDLAYRFAERSLIMDGKHYARGYQFNLALLAVAHVQRGEPEQAATVATQALVAAEGLHSARAGVYLDDLALRLAPYAGLPAVQEFQERREPAPTTHPLP